MNASHRVRGAIRTYELNLHGASAIDAVACRTLQILFRGRRVLHAIKKHQYSALFRRCRRLFHNFYADLGDAPRVHLDHCQPPSFEHNRFTGMGNVPEPG